MVAWDRLDSVLDSVWDYGGKVVKYPRSKGDQLHALFPAESLARDFMHVALNNLYFITLGVYPRPNGWLAKVKE